MKKDLECILLRKDYKYPNTLDRIKILIKDCEFLKLSTITPRILLGSKLLKLNLFKEAKENYIQAISISKEDPRTYLGLMHSEIGLRNLKSALVAINLCEVTARKTISNKNIQVLMLEIIYNKCKLLVLDNKFYEAERIINELNNHFKSLIEIKCLKLYLNVKLGIFNNHLYYYIKDYYNNNILKKEEAFILGELEYEIARYNYNSQNIEETILHLKKAIEYDRNEIRYVSELLLINKIHNLKIYSSAYEPKDILDYNPANLESAYYLGLIHFLKGNKSKARTYFKASRKLNYPKYKSYLPRKFFISSFLRI